MKLYRVVEKETGLFIRDDFEFDDSLEVGIDCEPSQGMYLPKYDFISSSWCESATQEYIDSLKQPLVEEVPLDVRVAKVELEQEQIVDVLAEILGV